MTTQTPHSTDQDLSGNPTGAGHDPAGERGRLADRLGQVADDLERLAERGAGHALDPDLLRQGVQQVRGLREYLQAAAPADPADGAAGAAPDAAAAAAPGTGYEVTDSYATPAVPEQVAELAQDEDADAPGGRHADPGPTVGTPLSVLDPATPIDPLGHSGTR